MRAVMLEVPEHWLEERCRLGHDRRDEVWDGVLHMVPQPTTPHTGLQRDLLITLTPLARARGYETFPETSLFGTRGEKNYRVPDMMVVRRGDISERGLEQHAELVIEILSPNDESRDKLPFYATCGVREVWFIEPKTRFFEIRSLDDDYATIRTESAVLGVKLAVVTGPLLRLEWADGAAEI